MDDGPVSRVAIVVNWYRDILNTTSDALQVWLKDSVPLIVGLIMFRTAATELAGKERIVLDSFIRNRPLEMRRGVDVFSPTPEEDGDRWPFSAPLGAVLLVQGLASRAWAAKADGLGVPSLILEAAAVSGVTRPLPDDIVYDVLMATDPKIYKYRVLPEQIYRPGDDAHVLRIDAIRILIPDGMNYHIWPSYTLHTWVLYNARYFSMPRLVMPMFESRVPDSLFAFQRTGTAFNTPILLAIDLYVNYPDYGVTERLLEIIFDRTPASMFELNFGMSRRSYAKWNSNRVAGFYDSTAAEYAILRERRGDSLHEPMAHNSLARIVADGNLRLGADDAQDRRIVAVLRLLNAHTGATFTLMKSRETWAAEMDVLRERALASNNTVVLEYMHLHAKYA